ncbi:MAG: shikimate dehydrogenase [Bacteroidota bacterium]|nr:shikimate dehydrogenase [Bacteroidota bacterium]
MELYGLLGKTLGHSFSKRYFTEKFEKLALNDHVFELFEIPKIEMFPELVHDKLPALKGMNVTIPYKQDVVKYLKSLDLSAQKVGAVNVIKFDKEGNGIGYNTDFYGFKKSLEETLVENNMQDISKALVLGTGGAARAVYAALIEMGISFKTVSREKSKADMDYETISEDIIQNKRLIINTSPVGMYPDIEKCPDIPYQYLTENNLLFDLVYNPENTLFMQKGLIYGAKVKNGLDMLYYQAEKAWEIWNN